MTTTPSPQHQDNLKAIRIMIGCFLIVFLFWLLLGCKSKEKAKNSKVYIEQVAKRDMKNIILRNNTKSMEIKSEGIKTISDFSTQEFSGQVADSTKPARREIEEKEGKFVETYYNFKTINTKNNQKTETKKDTIVQNLSKQDLSKIDLTQNSQTETNSKTKEKTTDVSVKGGIPWWLWLLLIIVLAVYGYISYLKRTINPMKWLS